MGRRPPDSSIEVGPETTGSVYGASLRGTDLTGQESLVVLKKSRTERRWTTTTRGPIRKTTTTLHSTIPMSLVVYTDD